MKLRLKCLHSRRCRYVEGSINLPWLNRRKHESEIAEAKAMVSQQDAEIAADQCSAGPSTTSIRIQLWPTIRESRSRGLGASLDVREGSMPAKTLLLEA
jgi:hypothetical protein